MQKKILVFIPNHFDIDQVIFKHLTEVSEYEVIKLINSPYRYKSIFERLLNFVLKNVKKKNLKLIKKAEEQLKQLNEKGPFDCCLVFRPDLLMTHVLNKIQHDIPVRKVVYWDSFSKIEALKATIQYFNQHFSFEKSDCEQYNFTPISNFYVEKANDSDPLYDAFFFGSVDSRFNKINKLLDYLSTKEWNAKALLIGKLKHKYNSDLITISKPKVPFAECYKFSENTKIVIDISHENQKGLSLRPYEAMGLKKKLITNNKTIKNYDFYDEKNIFIINDFNHLNIPRSFLEEPYQELPKHIYEKYYINNWLKKILE